MVCLVVDTNASNSQYQLKYHSKNEYAIKHHIVKLYQYFSASQHCFNLTVSNKEGNSSIFSLFIVNIVI